MLRDYFYSHAFLGDLESAPSGKKKYSGKKKKKSYVNAWLLLAFFKARGRSVHIIAATASRI